jgi:serine/threonine-protein kinase SRPK3
MLSDCKALHPDDVRPAAAFILACLRLDPKERPTAAELDLHDWIVGSDWGRDYRPPG